MLTLLTVLICAQDPETARVTLDAKDLPLGKVLDALRAQTKVPIELDEKARKAVDLDKERVTLSVQDLALTGVLRLLFGLHDLEAVVVDRKKILIVPK